MKKRLLVFLFGISVSFVFGSFAAPDKSWAWLYKKRFTPKSERRWAKEPSAWFEKRSIPKFSQLVFSWNAHRPIKGYYSFCARIRDARTKTWSQWYRMFEWGAGVQKSFAKSGKDGTKYVYVRLEADPKSLADAFQIRAVPINGANLSNIKQFSVSTSNFNLFKPEKISDVLLKLPSVIVSCVPKKSQMILNHPRACHMCSPTSWSMLAGFLTKKDVDPLSWAEKSFDSGFDTYGSWQFNVAQASDLCGDNIEFCTARFRSFKQLYKQLTRGVPAVVSVRGMLTGAPKSYDNGHLMVVVGWDAKKRQVICHDPALSSDQETLKRYDVKSFIEAWERSRRLTYFANIRHVSVKNNSSYKKRKGTG